MTTAWLVPFFYWRSKVESWVAENGPSWLCSVCNAPERHFGLLRAPLHVGSSTFLEFPKPTKNLGFVCSSFDYDPWFSDFSFNWYRFLWNLIKDLNWNSNITNDFFIWALLLPDDHILLRLRSLKSPFVCVRRWNKNGITTIGFHLHSFLSCCSNTSPSFLWSAQRKDNV